MNAVIAIYTFHKSNIEHFRMRLFGQHDVYNNNTPQTEHTLQKIAIQT